MKRLFTVHTKREYYIANIAGIIIMVGLISWFISLSINKNGIEFNSILFWLALTLILILPFAMISFFSSMKSIVVTEQALSISYIFKNHKIQINLNEIVAFKSTTKIKEPADGSSSFWESFELTLADGRVFAFSRSQFDDNFKKLKIILSKAGNRS